ncbi:response regulator [Mucilaginibacter polytrichastri]|uniref:histidine kinase n=1 Tax=Mucilaginibacter polytrichastri TaxID=1302689 RepID=A0A1Q5ZXE8_9SPHI|nr:response regulator [Mucilaginibacter polytrichastri]OKS86412.1 hypothetical protein RG47T_1868 [Mucilaginibacter polytrichastri]SFT27556.1 Signal transduction histidine kinase [Mucilaginibacter polytrichastri]
MPIPIYVFGRYRYLLSLQDDFIIKTRIKLLLVCILAFLGLFITLTILYIFQEHNFLLIRSSIYVVLFTVALFLLFSGLRWQIAGHFFLVCLTLLIWSNVILFLPAVNMVTVQFTVLVLAGSYYILGAKWGIIYSLSNMLPLMVNVIIANYGNYSIPMQHMVANNYAYVLTACFNFILLLHIHYSFFKALNKSNIKEKKLKKSLQIALLEANKLAEAKTNFLTTMSHELRTPLNAVVGMTNILLMENPKPAQKANLNILRFSAENLMATVNDILDFNKINNEEIILEKQIFQPAELVTNVISTFNAAAREKQLQLECIGIAALKGLNVLGDPMRLTQILLNLIGNAVKFTTNGFVRLEVSVINRDTKSATINFILSDSGIGIPDELKSKIFEPFTASLSRTSRQFHGALGLTIAFHLVRLHGNEMRFQSVEGEGTQFEFELTYEISAVPLLAKPVKLTSAINGLRVLIVEDEKLNILVMKKILALWQIIPDVAMDGQQGVDAVIDRDYDVILMDINMPVMDGFEAAKQIRQLPLPHKANIPIIAVTASISAAIEQIGRYPFIDDCLLKPFKPEDLKEKLMQIAAKDLVDKNNLS